MILNVNFLIIRVLFGLLILGNTGFGQVQLALDKTCYNIGDELTLTAEYTGSDTFAGVEWSYSGKTTQNIIVTTACTEILSDSGFPNARITHKCPPDTTNSKTFQLILSDMTQEDLDDKTWGATFQVSTLPNPDFVEVKPVECSAGGYIPVG